LPIQAVARTVDFQDVNLMSQAGQQYARRRSLPITSFHCSKAGLVLTIRPARDTIAATFFETLNTSNGVCDRSQ